jgi:tetratricopeptide (TPR) repeat protein
MSAIPAHGSESARATQPWQRTAWLFVLLVIVALVYWPGLGGGYTFDDYPNIVDNTALHVSRLVWNDWIAAILSSPASALQRPLAMLSFAINHYFTGLDPWPMKLTNLAIHLLNTLLVFGLVRSLLRALASPGDPQNRRNDRVALFTTAIWALHPINLMAVLFIVQRMESLCHAFVFAGLWMYVAGRMRQRDGLSGWVLIIGGLIGGTAFGLLAKESAALLPLYALCVEACLFGFRGEHERRDPRVLALFTIVLVLPGVVGLAWLLPRMFDPTAFIGRDFTLEQRLLTEPRVVFDYLRWTLLPNLNQLSLNHDDYTISRSLWDPPSTVFALLGISGLLVLAWFCRRRRPLVSLGLLWFLSAQLLTATIIPLELVFEHRNYFASLGICLALVDLLLLATMTATAKLAGAIVATIFVVFFAGITHLRAREWSDPLRFSSTEASKHPQSPRATYDLARTLVIVTNYHADSPLVGDTFRALEQARQAPRNTILPDQAALIFAARIGAPLQPAWWSDMQAKLREHPIGPQEQSAIGALTDCAVQKKCAFPTEAMLATFDAAASRGPNPEVMSMRGNYVLNVLGDSALALRLWRQASALRPNEREYHVSLAKLLIAMGQYDEARAQIAQLRKLGRLGQNEAMAEILETRLHHAAQQIAVPRPDIPMQNPAQPGTVNTPTASAADAGGGPARPDMLTPHETSLPANDRKTP